DASSRTLPGTILGTASYMSPEQVSGHTVDARSDIFSLGCVLYEMASGRRAFARKTSVETMTAILNDDAPDLPADGGGLRRIVAHCLEKQPEARFQSAQDLAFALRSLLSSTAPEKTVSAPGHRFVWPAIAAVFLVTTLALWFVNFRPATLRPREVRFDISPADGTTVIGGAFALSPDGNRLAFVASSDETPPHSRLWIHSLDTGGSQLLSAAGDVIGVVPVWSPDGRYIAFVTDGAIRK